MSDEVISSEQPRLYQIYHGGFIGVCEWNPDQQQDHNQQQQQLSHSSHNLIPGRISPSLLDISGNLFINLFMRPDFQPSQMEALEVTLQELYSYQNITLDKYKQVVLMVEEQIMTFIQSAYVRPDWILARRIWQKRVEQATCFSDVSFYIRDIELSCIDFAIVDALTTTTTRDDFIAQLEKQVNKYPSIPNEGEMVVYYVQGHSLALHSFKQHNAFSGLVELNDVVQENDMVCRVLNVSYYPGRGNAFVRLRLKPVQNIVVSTIVHSYYCLLNEASSSMTTSSSTSSTSSSTSSTSTTNNPRSFSITYPKAFPEPPSTEWFEVLMWMNNTETDFVIPMATYFNTVANNFREGDSFRMYFQGIESLMPNTGKKKWKEGSHLEGSYLNGRVVSIAPQKNDFFPWDALSVEWDAGANEAGTNHVNMWECEIVQKEASSKAERSKDTEKGRSGASKGEHRKHGEIDLKAMHGKLVEIIQTHTQKESNEFYRYLEDYWSKKGMEVVQPILSYEPLDMGLFWKMTQLYGGYENIVNTKGTWNEMYLLLPNYRAQNTSAATSMHKIYLKFLYQIEKEQREEKGLPPIIEPRLPVPLNPGKGPGQRQSRKEAVEMEEEEEEELDLESDDVKSGYSSSKAMKEKRKKKEAMKRNASQIEDMATEVDSSVLLMEKIVQEEERKKAVLVAKCKEMQLSLEYMPGTISTGTGEEVTNSAYQDIVEGSIDRMKKKIDMIAKFISSMKHIIHYYL